MAALEMMGNELLDIDDAGDEEDLLQHVRNFLHCSWKGE